MIIRAAAVLLAFMSPLLASATERDGNWWNRQEPAQKLGYIAGFFDGTTYAAILTTSAAVKTSADPKTGKYDSARGEVAKQVSLAAIDLIDAELKKLRDEATKLEKTSPLAGAPVAYAVRDSGPTDVKPFVRSRSRATSNASARDRLSRAQPGWNASCGMPREGANSAAMACSSGSNASR